MERHLTFKVWFHQKTHISLLADFFYVYALPFLECGWLLFNANWAMFKLCHGENKLMMRSTLCSTNTLSWICIVLAHWNNSLRIDISANSNSLSWFWASQFLLFLLCVVCLAEMQQITISLVFGLTRFGLEPLGPSWS
jgi:hypothetical protein